MLFEAFTELRHVVPPRSTGSPKDGLPICVINNYSITRIPKGSLNSRHCQKLSC